MSVPKNITFVTSHKPLSNVDKQAGNRPMRAQQYRPMSQRPRATCLYRPEQPQALLGLLSKLSHRRRRHVIYANQSVALCFKVITSNPHAIVFAVVSVHCFNIFTSGRSANVNRTTRTACVRDRAMSKTCHSTLNHDCSQ